ncbi:hypothetical protein H5410_032378 [Solanum commersonii]|uniref:DUF4371 domain-containing protein n=1 Tax=Solanum commersonii TaxID=4109 RepID=A0A9J5YMS0_SOLCO|nr:hypothetical protein H5410_032378 [Solanum commersonii]
MDTANLEDQSDSNVNSPALLNLSNDKHSEKAKSEYRILLNALIDVARFILKQGLPFLTDEERKCLGDKGNFEAFLEWYGNHVVPDVGRVISENAEMHQNMIAPSVLKNVVNVCAKETIKRIVEDLNGDYFGILVDKQRDVDDFFGMLSFVLKVIRVSFECQDFSQENQVENLEELLKFGKILTGRDFNQKYDELERSGNAPLESYFETLRSFITIFPSVVHILEATVTDDVWSSERMWADSLLDDLQSFEFFYMLHVMFKVLLITKELDIVLQRKDQDIVNALKLVGTTKRQFEMMRDGEWEHLMDDVSSFCVKHDILIPKIVDLYVIPRGLKRKVSTFTYSYHYRVKVFDAIIDSQLQELDRCFDTVSNDLLLGMTSLSLVNSFANYDKDNIARYYPDEFSDDKLQELSATV